MNAEISDIIRARLLGLGMQIPEHISVSLWSLKLSNGYVIGKDTRSFGKLPIS